MRILAIATLLVCGSVLAAKSYEVKMDASLDGKRFSSQSLVVKAGETATIFEKTENEEKFVEVEALPQTDKTVRMNITLGKIGPNGERIILSRPELIASEDKEAKISSGDLSGEQLSLSVSMKEKKIVE